MKNIIFNKANVIELQSGLDIQKLQYSDIPCLHSELAGADIARWLQELSSMVYLVRRSGGPKLEVRPLVTMDHF